MCQHTRFPIFLVVLNFGLGMSEGPKSQKWGLVERISAKFGAWWTELFCFVLFWQMLLSELIFGPNWGFLNWILIKFRNRNWKFAKIRHFEWKIGKCCLISGCGTKNCWIFKEVLWRGWGNMKRGSLPLPIPVSKGSTPRPWFNPKSDMPNTKIYGKKFCTCTNNYKDNNVISPRSCYRLGINSHPARWFPMLLIVWFLACIACPVCLLPTATKLSASDHKAQVIVVDMNDMPFVFRNNGEEAPDLCVVILWLLRAYCSTNQCRSLQR